MIGTTIDIRTLLDLLNVLVIPGIVLVVAIAIRLTRLELKMDMLMSNFGLTLQPHQNHREKNNV